MSVPSWIKLAAASKDELLREVLVVIEEMGGVDAAEKELKELASDRTSNWAAQELFISSRKTLQQILKEREEQATEEEWNVKKKQEETKSDEVPQAEDVEEVKKEAPDLEEKPQKSREDVSRAVYLSTLIGLLLGFGGMLGADQLRKLNLRKALEEARRASPELYEPLPPPTSEEALTEEEWEEQRQEYEKQIKEKEKAITTEKDPNKKKELQEELDSLRMFYEKMHRIEE